MKYGESTFDILYLGFAIVCGILVLRGARNRTERLMGIAALVLGCGDAFHLVPRVLRYMAKGDFTAALGVGKLVTSVTMTVFYVLLYYVWRGYYGARQGMAQSSATQDEAAKPEEAAQPDGAAALPGARQRGVTAVVWGAAIVRIALCLFPQNGWLQNSSDMTWGIIRNVPFVVLGAVICLLYFEKRGERRGFRWMWLYILLSFAFYIPVAVGAGAVPMLGMLMLPKTICYIFMLATFLREVRRGPRE